MVFAILFWFLSLASLILLGLWLMGYNVLEIIITLLIINIVLVETIRQVSQKESEQNLRKEILERVANIEKIAENIVKTLEGNPKDLERQKAELKFEFKESMDKMAEKAIEIENRLSELKRTVGAVVASFDERFKTIEGEEDFVEVKVEE